MYERYEFGPPTYIQISAAYEHISAFNQRAYDPEYDLSSETPTYVPDEFPDQCHNASDIVVCYEDVLSEVGLSIGYQERPSAGVALDVEIDNADLFRNFMSGIDNSDVFAMRPLFCLLNNVLDTHRQNIIRAYHSGSPEEAASYMADFAKVADAYASQNLHMLVSYNELMEFMYLWQSDMLALYIEETYPEHDL